MRYVGQSGCGRIRRISYQITLLSRQQWSIVSAPDSSPGCYRRVPLRAQQEYHSDEAARSSLQSRLIRSAFSRRKDNRRLLAFASPSGRSTEGRSTDMSSSQPSACPTRKVSFHYGEYDSDRSSKASQPSDLSDSAQLPTRQQSVGDGRQSPVPPRLVTIDSGTVSGYSKYAGVQLSVIESDRGSSKSNTSRKEPAEEESM
jgi:hypothetical protein